MKRINIKKELNIKPIKKYIELLTPEFIYIPYNKEKIDILTVKKNQKINKIISSISGEIIGKTKIRKKKYLVVKNDYKETKFKEKKEPILDLNNINTLYINAIDEEPYSFNNYYYLKNYKDEIAAALDLYQNTYNIENIYIITESDYHDIVELFEEIIVSNNIRLKIIPNEYPIGNNEVLKEYLKLSNNSKIIDLYTFLSNYEILHKNTYLNEKYITIYGNNIKEPIVIKVKKYTRLSDYFKEVELINDNFDIILNNSLCGKIITDCIIDDEINTIIINKKVKRKEFKCNKCGYCTKLCPMKINPLLPSNKCIKCGLCNYICPNNIKLRDIEVKDE